MATSLTISRLMSYRVPNCPVCHKAHDYQLDIQYQTDITIFTIIREPVSLPITLSPVWKNEITFICLTSPNEHFTCEVTITPQTDEKIISVAMYVSPASFPAAPPVTPSTFSINSMVEDDLATWFKTSRSTVQDFCKTMITTATGAIAVFFAVLKFLGGDTGGTAKVVTATFAGVASALFLLSALTYILGLEPQYIQDIKSLEGYLEDRKSRLKTMNTYIVWGTTFFALGTFLAILSFIFAYLKI
jgi:hypothetical protein